jgi:hypothetical protein
MEKVKVKVKLSLCLTKHHAMKAYWRSGDISTRILVLGTGWRWVVSFTHRPLYPQRKNPRYPLDRWLGEPQSCSGRGDEEKNCQPPPGIELWNPDRPARSPVLYRLSYHDSRCRWHDNKLYLWEKIKSGLNSGNACYHAVQSFVFPSHLYKLRLKCIKP